MNSLLKKPTMRFSKAHPDALLPQKNHSDDAGWDVFSVEDKEIPPKGSAIVDVGLKLAYLEPGYWIRVSSRSGLSFKHNILAHPGVIDNGYRGSLGVLLYNHSDTMYKVNKGDRVAQLVLHFNIDIDVEWGEVQNTLRGEKGFGASGK
jgi:deoxyuridine 5'-triphosphate nucleotidohydrolase